MKATFTDRKTKFTTSHRKETPCHFESYTVIDAEHPVRSYGDQVLAMDIVNARIYSSGMTTSACIWIHGDYANGQEISGSGKACGMGYHRASEAIARAIDAAGIDIKEEVNGADKKIDIGGRGESAIEQALLAIAREIGATRPVIVKSHP